MNTHAGSTFYDSVTLTFDLLISALVHENVCLPSLVLIAQAVSL